MKAVIKEHKRHPTKPLNENTRLIPDTNTPETKLLIRDGLLEPALNDREREVIDAMYFQKEDSQDIARRLGISRGRVNQIERTALVKMYSLAEKLNRGSVKDWLPSDEVSPAKSKRRAGADEQSMRDVGAHWSLAKHSWERKRAAVRDSG